ncbi:MAG: CYTH domain-containing protein [Candidatus Gracilibacteria bacterium]|nr:CYTH domain-containing protein [Candidatus Gracilibacteria bacterium]
MQKEIEKKYELTASDYAIIQDKCEFIEKQELKDYYLDTAEFTLAKHDYFLRLRNGKYELKILTVTGEVHESEEYEDEDIINEKLSEFDITIDDTTGVTFVDTNREKYHYNLNGIEFHIDIDRYQYDSRYEIEIIITDGSDFDGEAKIEGLRKLLGLTADGGKKALKLETCAMYQNIGYYEIISNY